MSGTMGRGWPSEERRNDRRSPIAIYEVHLGSWRRNLAERGRYLTYRELAAQLVPYVHDMGFTHIEILPVTEYPFDGSWDISRSPYSPRRADLGHETISEFSSMPATMQGSDYCSTGCPVTFRTTRMGSGALTGRHLRACRPAARHSPRLEYVIYNYGRREVANFLLSSALYWLREFHIDGIRVDAVASMLYLDYSRREGEWIPNSSADARTSRQLGFCGG